MTRKNIFCLAVLAFSLILASACTDPVTSTVKVTGGYIEGYEDNGLTIFKGIPFAAPPIGELRWKAPQDVTPWEGVLETKNFAKGPVQPGNPADYSEDCLYLNVWTPAKKVGDKLPVLVWIYGGGFAMGNTADPNYDCEALARKNGDVILASMNYRVGQMGFFAHPALSAESPEGVSGNYGLLDQIAALKWIQENITAFGGDPEKVTIFGESAGGISVSMLCASPLAAGLFRGAISESGGNFSHPRMNTYPGENMQDLAMAEASCSAIAEELGAKTAEELRALKPEAFMRFMMGAGSWPIVDGYVIPGDQYELYENGQFNDVNVLIGYNSDEGASFSGSFAGLGSDHATGVHARFEAFADTLLAAYPLEPDGTVAKPARDLLRDVSFGWHTWSWARLQTEKGSSKAYLYYFDQPNPGAEGSPHGQEVGYVFQHLDAAKESEESLALSEIMGQYWLNFTKYGTPSPEGSDLPEWTAFSNEDPQCMILSGPEPQMGPVPDETSLWVLNSYYQWRRTPEGHTWE